jgi:hypothetical protein
MSMRNGKDDCEAYKLPVDGLELVLRHHPARGQAEATVLLLHGGNTSSSLYSEPDGGLVQYLTTGNVDTWTLDWRASAAIVDPLVQRCAPLGGDAATERELFTLDNVAEKDIPCAIRKMEKLGVVGDISVLGFCLGGGSLSMAIARGCLEGFASVSVSNVLLVTMGLFYEVPWDGWIKAEDFILERILSTRPDFRAVSAALPDLWPRELQAAYDRLPQSWLGASSGQRRLDELFKRLTFMYGEPYARARLDPGFERKLVEGHFGSLHMGLYLHASQMVRRGFAARYNELDVIDRSRLDQRKTHGRRRRGTQKIVTAPSDELKGDLIPDHFRDKRVTVFAGSDDRLWHRDSMDLMYEWLRNEATPARERERHRKHVLPFFGHLDLFWSPDAPAQVFPLMEAAIKQPRLVARAALGCDADRDSDRRRGGDEPEDAPHPPA